jgi:Kef-type K+ transport system membrane component KefB
VIDVADPTVWPTSVVHDRGEIGPYDGHLREPALPIATDGVTGVDEASFLVVVMAAAVAALTVAVLPRGMAPPVVVIELVLGIVIGPQVLGLAETDDFIDFFSNLGLGMLFFFAGYEIEFDRIRGRPLALGAAGWALSLALAYGLGGILAAAGVVISLLYTGSALATTAIGTLLPILRDSGELRTKFGTYLLAAGGVGEFGPILLFTLVLSTTHPLHEAAILIAFVALAVVLALFSVRVGSLGIPVLERTLEASSQLAVRIAVLLIFGLAALAGDLGLDVLLGGFVAGIVTRTALRGGEMKALESKLTAVGFGFLVPFFFVTSGISFDLDALLASVGALLKLPLFLTLFLVVRGAPALLLYRGVLDDARARVALAFFSATALPLVVAITTVAQDGGHMSSATAAALVGAAILSTLIFPLAGLSLLKGAGGPSPAASEATAGGV